MMHSLVGAGTFDHASQTFSTIPVTDDFLRQQQQQQQQLLQESASRMSRGSFNGYRPANSMRVVKPSSASNSPQAVQQRRRTLMNDGNLARRRQYALDQAILNHQIQGQTYDAYQEPVKRTSRPLSWHPGSQIPQQQQQTQMRIQQMPQFDVSQYMVAVSTPYTDVDMYTGYQQFPPTPAVYSGQTSPVSSFSPLSLPFMASTQPQIPQGITADSCMWNMPTYINAAPVCTDGSPDTTESFPAYTNQSSLEWEAFAANGFDTCTAPPTPDNYQHEIIQQDTVVPDEEVIPYQSLDEAEDEGEILVGMGLYDAPEKSETDPGLDHYRTTTSDLLGSTYRKGAGLKLEEAWEPPKEDDSSNEEDDAEADGDDDDA